MSANTREEDLSGTGLVFEGESRRLHVSSSLMMESLIDRGVIASTHVEKEVHLYPNLNIVKVGGSIIDGGRKALMPLVEEIVANKDAHEMVIGAGGGARERHTYAIGLDLGLPTGGLAMLAGAIGEQNALLLQVLLAKANGIRIAKDDMEQLPLFLKSGSIPVIVATPPYMYWEHPSRESATPQHGTDTGVYYLAEVFSARSCILLKDVEGLYTEDPKTGANPRFIERISCTELLDLGLPSMPIERGVLEAMAVARNCKEVRLVSGLVPGALTRALNGEDVGTLIYKPEPEDEP